LTRLARISKFELAFSHGVAAEGSPRREPWERMVKVNKPRSGERARQRPFFFRPIRGSTIATLSSHGSRRGLSSNAAPQLFPRFVANVQILRCAHPPRALV